MSENEKTLVEYSEELGGVVTDITDAEPLPKEKATFPADEYIQETVGGKKQFIGEDGTRYDEYGKVILKGSNDDTKDSE